MEKLFLATLWAKLLIIGRVYSAGKNFIGKINPDVILPVKLKFYRQNKSRSYSAGKTKILSLK